MKHRFRCSCTVLVNRVQDMCTQCKVNYMEWITGVALNDLRNAYSALYNKQVENKRPEETTTRKYWIIKGKF